MDVYSWIIFMYVAGTMIVGWLLVTESSLFRRKSKEKLVGPSYWGFYNDVAGEDFEGETSIKLAELPEGDDEAGVCGGRGYSSGRAVKSARV